MDHIYVDNSNLFIEGRRVSAVDKGEAADIWDAMENDIFDNSYTIDFGKLFDFLCGADKRQIKRAALFGSRPPPNDSLWAVAKHVGFEPHIKDRNFANKEKKIDTGIVALMAKDAYKGGDKDNDLFVLVAGDGDFVPVVEDLQEDGFKVEIVFWEHASRELKQTAMKQGEDKFVNLNPYLRDLQFSRS